MPRDRELDHDLTAPASYAPVPARPAGHAGPVGTEATVALLTAVSHTKLYLTYNLV
jgi:hypothetical protein